MTAIVAILFLASCTKDKTTETPGVGSLKIHFENGFAENGLVLGSPTTATSNDEILKISKIKYIISNIVLTKEDGTTFTYPKSQSYFIVDEEISPSLEIELANIPYGNYKKVTFGVGVDQAQFDLGATGQGNLWTNAQTAGMTWSWASGYKFLAFEGTFTSPTYTSDVSFMIHTGKTGTDYNYTVVSLDLPTIALVRATITPEIHMSTDLSQIIDGENKINLSSKNEMGMGAMIMGGADLPLITANLSNMFSVEHVHNDPN